MKKDVREIDRALDAVRASLKERQPVQSQVLELTTFTDASLQSRCKASIRLRVGAENGVAGIQLVSPRRAAIQLEPISLGRYGGRGYHLVFDITTKKGKRALSRLFSMAVPVLAAEPRDVTIDLVKMVA